MFCKKVSNELRTVRLELFLFGLNSDNMLPKEVRREILLNAVNHKDYSKGVPIQISVYDDKIYIWNDGKFPEMLSADNIYEKHSSIPYNPKVADVLFKAGMIESWGRGFDKIKEECEANNTPLPKYEISERGIMVLCKPGEKYLKLLKKYGLGTKEDNVPIKLKKTLEIDYCLWTMPRRKSSVQYKLFQSLQITEKYQWGI